MRFIINKELINTALDSHELNAVMCANQLYSVQLVFYVFISTLRYGVQQIQRGFENSKQVRSVWLWFFSKKMSGDAWAH